MRPSCDELRQRQAGDLAADGVEAAEDHRLGRVVDDQVDAGRLLEGADVAALAADDAALHLVARQVHHRDGVLRRVVGGDALHRGDDDVARLLAGCFARRALDGAGDPHGVVLGFLADRFEQQALRVVGGQAADALERGDLFLGRAGELIARLVELALAFHELAVALLEHVRALVDLLVALEQPALQGRELRALGACLVFGLTLQAELLVLGVEDQVLLLRPRALDDQGGLLGGLLDRAVREDAAAKEAEYGAAGEGHEGHRQEHDLHDVLPSGRFAGRWSSPMRPIAGRWGGMSVVTSCRVSLETEPLGRGLVRPI